jgi:lipid A 3-O-deacylase
MRFSSFIVIKRYISLVQVRCLLVVLMGVMQSQNLFAQNSRTPADSSTFTFTFENDLFGDSDAQYTNGIQLGWQSRDLDHYAQASRLPPWIISLAEGLPFINKKDRLHNIGIALGQQIFTPADTTTPDLIVDDRPYAGWLYGAVNFISKTDLAMDSVELQAGVLGPWSQAERAQNLVHNLRDLPTANGWKNQLDNEPGFVLIYEHRDRQFGSQNIYGWGYDLISNAGATVGNVYCYANLGAAVRLGWNLPSDFGTSIIRPGGDTNAPSALGDSRLSGVGIRRVGFHLFSGISGRIVLRDIFLDGNTFADSHRLDKENLVGDWVVGASLNLGQLKLSYAQNFRTREFEHQPTQHNFGSISLSWTF